MLLKYLCCKRKAQIKTVFLIDIFHMKSINASYGFKNGDAVLRQLNKLLKTLIKNEINELFVGKYSKNNDSTKIVKHHSDVISVTFYADLSEVMIINIKNIIIKKLRHHQFQIASPNLTIHINTTIGCSKSADKKLFIYAEKALHNAKKNLDAFLFFDANLYKNESTNNDLIDLIKYNIETTKVEPYFQAIFSNKENKIVKYEALMRLFDREGNAISPSAFLEKAKSYRLYVDLMKIMLNKVFDIIAKHKINVSINLEYNDIIHPLISDLVLTRTKALNIGEYLTIEILESERIKDFDVINDFIHKVKKDSMSIAIDDFGTGFANFEYILKLNVDYLKIDGSLILRINEEIYMSLIKSIVMFCKQQNIKTVAEFVCDLKRQRYVQSLEIDYSQGYHIQKPLPITAIVGGKSEK